MWLLRKQKDQPPNRTCQRCGKAFYCGASLLGCWCMEIKLSEEARAHMQRKYKDCLCRDCLWIFSGPRETWDTPA